MNIDRLSVKILMALILLSFTFIAICYFWNYGTFEDSTNFEFSKKIVQIKKKRFVENKNLKWFYSIVFMYVFISKYTKLRNSDFCFQLFQWDKKSHNFLNMQYNTLNFRCFLLWCWDHCVQQLEILSLQFSFSMISHYLSENEKFTNQVKKWSLIVPVSIN